MKSEIARTIASSMIWVCTAIILAGGLYRMNGDAMFFVLTTVVIIGGAVVATGLVWQLPRSKHAAAGFDVVMPVEAINRGTKD